jgi:hypothetical protein
VWRFFKHPLEAMVLITFVSVMGLAVERLISRPLPAELGGGSPFAHILIMGGASMAALYLLRHIRADLQGRTPGSGFVGRATDVALGLGLKAGLRGTGSAAVGGARGLHDRLGAGGKTPWERLDEMAAANPRHVLGPPQEGFTPVPTESHGTPDQPGEAPGPADQFGPGPAGGGGQEATIAPNSVAPGVDPLIGTAGAAAAATRPAQRPHRRSGKPAAVLATAAGPAVLDPDSVAASGPGAAAEVPSIGADPAHRATSGWQGAPPLSAYVDHADADIPLPTPPPEDQGMPPPPVDPGGPAATVDPITGR